MLMYNKDYPDHAEIYFYTESFTVKKGFVDASDSFAIQYLRGLGFVPVKKKDAKTQKMQKKEAMTQEIQEKENDSC